MIEITQGDAATLNFTATDGNGNPIDLTGATFQSYVRGNQGQAIVWPNGYHTANPDQVNFRGQFTVSLASSDTSAIPAGFNKGVTSQITIGGSPVNYRGENILTVFLQTPRV